MKKDNRGFTLIELLVVIAIMGILAGVVATSTSLSAAARAKSCATQITDYLARTRIGCLSRADTSYMKVTQNENGAYVLSYYEGGTNYTNGHIVNSSTISGSGVTVRNNTGYVEVAIVYSIKNPLSEVKEFTASFTRTGALTAPQCDGSSNCGITVTGAGRTYTITVTPATGAITCS